MYNLINYNYNYSKTSGSLWPYYRGETALAGIGTTEHFTTDNADTKSFKIKQNNRSNRGQWYKKL